MKRKRLLRLAGLAVSCGLTLILVDPMAFANAHGAPEIDPGTAAAGIALVTTMVVLAVERFRAGEWLSPNLVRPLWFPSRCECPE
jgi:hypothetical protein